MIAFVHTYVLCLYAFMQLHASVQACISALLCVFNANLCMQMRGIRIYSAYNTTIEWHDAHIVVVIIVAFTSF